MGVKLLLLDILGIVLMDKNYFFKWFIKLIIFIGYLIILMVVVRKEFYICNLVIMDLIVVGIL